MRRSRNCLRFRPQQTALDVRPLPVVGQVQNAADMDAPAELVALRWANRDPRGPVDPDLLGLAQGVEDVVLEERRVQLDADARGFERPIAVPEPQIQRVSS